jgi:hypothetical protein
MNPMKERLIAELVIILTKYQKIIAVAAMHSVSKSPKRNGTLIYAGVCIWIIIR